MNEEEVAQESEPMSSTVSPGAKLNISEPTMSTIHEDHRPSTTSGACKDMNKIISDTLEIVKTQKERVDTQKSFLSQLSFILNRIHEGISTYNGMTGKINTFLVNNEKRTADMYANYCCHLPGYGDYAEVLTDSDQPVQVEELNNPVSQRELKQIVEQVVNVFYAAGTELKNHRMLCKGVNNAMKRRRDFYHEHNPPFASWFYLVNAEANNQAILAEQLFQISSFIDYVKAEDKTIAPELDLSNIASGQIL